MSADAMHGPAIASRELPETRAKTDRQFVVENIIAGAVVVLPAIGFAFALWHASRYGVSTFDLVVAAVLYSTCIIGTTVGLHRYFTHKAFEARPWVKVFLGIAGSLALQGPVIRWVADHRRHHAHSDEHGDVHSPHSGRGKTRLVRFLWAHMAYFFVRDRTVVRRFAPDLLSDPVILTIDGLYPLWAVVSLGLPALLGFLVTGTAAGALSGFLWGGLTRLFFLYHMTWCVNSVCHVLGTRPYDTTDLSRNNFLVNLAVFGEGWHNNHHAFPASARLGHRWWQLDIGWIFIRTLEVTGQVSKVRTPPPWAKRGTTRARTRRDAPAGVAVREDSVEVGTLVDISATGAGINVSPETGHEVGRTVALSFQLPSEAPIEVHARVARVSAKMDVVGLEFEDLSAEHKAKIEAFVAAGGVDKDED